jgi:hypothetical protein
MMTHYYNYELMKYTQTDCFACQEPLPIEELPFFGEIIRETKCQKTDPAVWVFNWLLMRSLQSHVSTSLPPVVYDDSEMLIFGAKLLKNDKYETAKSNRFWQDISKRYNGGRKFYDKVDKISCLKRHHLALWDVFNPDGTKNDVDAFLRSNPQIKEVMFYGKNVMRYYKPKMTKILYLEFSESKENRHQTIRLQ